MESSATRHKVMSKDEVLSQIGSSSMDNTITDNPLEAGDVAIPIINGSVEFVESCETISSADERFQTRPMETTTAAIDEQEQAHHRPSNLLTNESSPSQLAPLTEFLKSHSENLPLQLPILLEEIANYCDVKGLKVMQEICQKFADGPQTLRFCRSYGANRTVVDLPPEILSMIAQRCDNDTFKTFRLVCRHFEEVSLPWLIGSTVRFLGTASGFRKIRGLAGNQLVSTAITKLEYFSGDWSHIKSQQAWEKDAMHRSCSNCQSKQDFEKMDAKYQNFLQFQEEQKEMKDDNYPRKSLTKAFEAFKSLNAVTILGSSHMRHSGEILDQYLELSTTIGGSSSHDNNNSRALIDVLCATYESGAQIKTVNTGWVGIGFLATENEEQLLNNVHRGMHTIEHLTIQVDLCEYSPWYRDEGERTHEDEYLAAKLSITAHLKGLLAKFLHEAIGLKSLNIEFGSSMQPLHDGPNFCEKVFGCDPFPHLEELVLTNICTSSDELLETITRHRYLTALRLTSVTLTWGTWSDFFTDLRDEVARRKTEFVAHLAAAQNGALAESEKVNPLTITGFHGPFAWIAADFETRSYKQMCTFAEDKPACSLGDSMALWVNGGNKHGDGESESPWLSAKEELLYYPLHV